MKRSTLRSEPEPEPEVYSPERKAQFLLNSAVDQLDYERARDEVRQMGLDPDSVPHDRPR